MPEFDAEKVHTYQPIEYDEMPGPMVAQSDYLQLLALLHDVSSEADPAGTLRENRMLQDKVAAQEKLIEGLKLEVARLKDQLEFERDLQG